MSNTRIKRFARDISSESRIYVLGVGNLGKFVAHALKKHHPQLPVSLLLHRTDLISEWEACGRAIECVTNDVSDKRTGFDVELLPISTGKEFLRGLQPPIKHLIMATKTYMTVSAMSMVKHRLGSTSSILFLQNGMGTMEEVSTSLFSDVKSRPSFWAGICSCGIYSVSPFSVVHAGRGPIILGSVSGRSNDSSLHSPPISVTHDFMIQCLLETPDAEATLVTPEQIKEAQLQKLIVNAMINPLTAIFRCKNGQLFDQPPRLALMKLLLEEAGDIIRAILPRRPSRTSGESGFANENLLVPVLRVATNTGDSTSSMLQDIEAGRKTEIDYINGYLVLQGQRLGLPYINNDTLINMVKQRRVIRDDEIQSLFNKSCQI